MLLSIHTCGSRGSLALGRIDPTSGEAEIVAQAELAARTYSAQLIPKIAEMLAAHSATIHDLEAIVVVRGPGSFTGTRVGLSAAKGLAEASGAKLIALSRLELLAGRSGRDHVLAAVDAGRGECYLGEYRRGQVVREALCTAAEVGDALSKPDAGVLVCEAPEETGSGRGVGEFSVSRARPDRAPAHDAGSSALFGEPIYLRAPDAAEALRFAAPRFRGGLFDDIELLDANYLRRSDAEIFGAHAPDQASRPASHAAPKPPSEL